MAFFNNSLARFEYSTVSCRYIVGIISDSSLTAVATAVGSLKLTTIEDLPSLKTKNYKGKALQLSLLLTEKFILDWLISYLFCCPPVCSRLHATPSVTSLLKQTLIRSTEGEADSQAMHTINCVLSSFLARLYSSVIWYPAGKVAMYPHVYQDEPNNQPNLDLYLIRRYKICHSHIARLILTNKRWPGNLHSHIARLILTNKRWPGNLHDV